LGDSNSAALVYYTFNGSTPVPGVSWELPAGFTVPVDTSETVSAVAVAPGYSPSNVVSAAYAIKLAPSRLLRRLLSGIDDRDCRSKRHKRNLNRASERLQLRSLL
jgi:hypothetical protein